MTQQRHQGWYVIKNAVWIELKSASRPAVIVDITAYLATRRAAAVGAVKVLNHLPLTFLSLFFFFITLPLPRLCTLHFIWRSLFLTRLKLFHSSFNLLSLIKTLSSLALRAKRASCGRCIVCMHAFTCTRARASFEKVIDCKGAIMHPCTALSDWLWLHTKWNKTAQWNCHQSAAN